MLDDALLILTSPFSISTFICMLLSSIYLLLSKFKSYTQDDRVAVILTRSGIESLPLELLSDIMVRLDVEDILRIRRVSRYLNYATHGRPIWLALVKHNGTRFMVNKRFELYTAQELEGLVRQTVRRDASWSSNGPAIVRRLPVERPVGKIQILPGGRWLLSMPLDGGVVYNDLDSISCEPRTLIPGLPSRSGFRWEQSHVCVDLKQTSEYLAFNILLVTTRRRTKNETSPLFSADERTTCHIQVFDVSVEFDDSGHISGLRADCLSSFHETNSLAFYKFSLRGEMLAYHINNPRYSILVEWRKADGKVLDFPRRRLNLKTLMSTLLSEKVLLAWSSNEVFVYDLASLDLPVFTEPPSDDIYLATDPFWSSPWPHHVPQYIQPLPITADFSVSMLFPLAEGILQLTVSKLLSRQSPTIDMLSMQPTRQLTCVLQSEKGIELHDARLTTYRYNKDKDGTILSIDSFTRNISIPGESGKDPKVYLDGYSGRIYVCFLHTHYTVDLA